MIFKDPLLLLLLPLLAIGVFIYMRREKHEALPFSSVDLLTGIKRTVKSRLLWVPLSLRFLAAAMLIIALAGPQKLLDETLDHTQGIDLVIAIDVSGSMMAEDFEINGQRQNRLEVVKNVVKDFILSRRGDRLSLVVFAGRAYSASPLTTDHSWLLTNLERVQMGIIEDGTAIGSGIATSVSRLQKSDAKSKVIVLLTDGSNNAGTVTPDQAAIMAKALGIKIYTIGAGTKGMAPYPVMVFGRKMYQQAQVDIDENILTQIAQITGGAYFRATDTASLKSIYQQIDQLEKTEIKQTGYKEYEPLMAWFILIAMLLIALEIFLANTVLLRVP